MPRRKQVYKVTGMPFGHTALSQFGRTGEKDGGLAFAGLIIGYIYLVPIVVFVAVFSVGCSASRPHNSSGSSDPRPITSNNTQEHVMYDVFGPAGPTAPDPVGVTANINYVDTFGKPQRVDNVRLPWRLIMVKSALPSVNITIVAQTNADQISCRITVNDVVKAEKTVVKTGVRAETNCAVTT